MSFRPRVSVVIPAFQSETRIGRTLARLKQQTFTDFEIVVVNDGSTDGTAHEIQRAMASDSRIRVVEQSNCGLARARNRGVEASRGDMIAFLDDDDLWHPNKLALQVDRFDSASGPAVVTCYSALVDIHGNLLGWRFGGRTEGNVYREMLEWDMVSGGSVALVSRGAIESCGGFDETLSEREDWDLWIRIARGHSFACVPKTLVGYTRRHASLSRRYDGMLARGRRVLEKARQADASISNVDYQAYLAREMFGAACLCLVDSEHDLAWRYLTGALRNGPAMILSRPRRLGVITMLALASALPRAVYRSGPLTAMSRVAFGFEPGKPFDSLA
jgi:glycosyltransferase involved in cell wall biosynthesis